VIRLVLDQGLPRSTVQDAVIEWPGPAVCDETSAILAA
jgi:hypothetical protein